MPMIDYPLPLLGFCAYSGTGKTTLLTQVLPLLKESGLRVGMVKHAHHSFDIDHPGKDSYELRKAGAAQMLVASRRRTALIIEAPLRQEEPQLEDALALLQSDALDLVLVEGFKLAHIPKIELHRPSMGKALMYPHDPDIIAIASDSPLPDIPASLVQLDLNQPREIADYIRKACLVQNQSTPSRLDPPQGIHHAN